VALTLQLELHCFIDDWWRDGKDITDVAAREISHGRAYDHNKHSTTRR
jgi:hypothetical protein